jgi:hypothetical protein
MNIGNAIAKVGNKLTGKLGKTGLILKAKSPEILIGAGIVLVLGGTYMACRATSKAKDVIARRDIEIDELKYREAEALEQLSETCAEQEIKVVRKETKSDIFVAHVRCCWELTKLYAPAIAIEAAGIGCFLGAHGIMRKRNAALMAAYEATDKAYRRLKEERDKGLLTDGTECKEGEKLVEKKDEDQKNCPFSSDLGPWAFMFDEDCNVWKPSDSTILMEAKAVERSLTNRLNAGRTIFLNDIRTAFGEDIPGPNLEGQIICWDKTLGDTEIDLGLPRSEDYIFGKSFWINPKGGHKIQDLPCLRRR